MFFRLLILALWFVAGAIAAAAPFLISAQLRHLEETARGEQTMGPGIVTMLGLLAAPVGGLLGLLAGWLVSWLRSRRAGTGVADKHPTEP